MSDKSKKDEKSPFAGALADKLKDLDIEPSDKKPAEERAAKEPKPAEKPRSRRAELEGPEEPDELSDEELFARAVEELAPEDVYHGKFQGKGPELPEASSPGSPSMRGPSEAAKAEEAEPSDEAARKGIEELRELRQFEKAVGPVEKNVTRKKYHRPSRPDPAKHAEQVAAFRSDSPQMLTPPLPKSGEGLNHVGPLEASQKQMLERYNKRSRRHDVPEINIRGDTVEDALRQIELFVHHQWKEGAHFVRIIHGRGLQSDGAPVLKPAVLRWLEGPGFRYVRGYVPELNSAGDYGSLVVELEERKA